MSMIDNIARFPFLKDLEITHSQEHTCYKLNEVRSLLSSNVTITSLSIVMPNVDNMNMEFLLDIISDPWRYMSLSRLVVRTELVHEPLTEEQVNHFMQYRVLTVLELGSFRMFNFAPYILWRKLSTLKKFIIRIVNIRPIQQNALLTRFVRTDTGFDITAPIIRLRRRDDAVIFRRS